MLVYSIKALLCTRLIKSDACNDIQKITLTFRLLMFQMKISRFVCLPKIVCQPERTLKVYFLKEEKNEERVGRDLWAGN